MRIDESRSVQLRVEKDNPSNDDFHPVPSCANDLRPRDLTLPPIHVDGYEEKSEDPSLEVRYPNDPAITLEPVETLPAVLPDTAPEIRSEIMRLTETLPAGVTPEAYLEERDQLARTHPTGLTVVDPVEDTSRRLVALKQRLTELEAHGSPQGLRERADDLAANYRAQQKDLSKLLLGDGGIFGAGRNQQDLHAAIGQIMDQLQDTRVKMRGVVQESELALHEALLSSSLDGIIGADERAALRKLREDHEDLVESLGPVVEPYFNAPLGGIRTMRRDLGRPGSAGPGGWQDAVLNGGDPFHFRFDSGNRYSGDLDPEPDRAWLM
ncbi:MAG: hypothetical protein HYV63_18755 [Candidatus Schekmanbacteria bacterium]|nr:hypothetical protein [Candidatus Schekmanbacteria bacterium]